MNQLFGSRGNLCCPVNNVFEFFAPNTLHHDTVIAYLILFSHLVVPKFLTLIVHCLWKSETTISLLTWIWNTLNLKHKSQIRWVSVFFVSLWVSPYASTFTYFALHIFNGYLHIDLWMKHSSDSNSVIIHVNFGVEPIGKWNIYFRYSRRHVRAIEHLRTHTHTHRQFVFDHHFQVNSTVGSSLSHIWLD